MLSYYDILHLKAGADDRAIRSAYLALMSVYHPDRCAGGEKFAHFHAARINEAYAVLIDPERRANYDARLAAGRRRWPFGARARGRPAAARPPAARRRDHAALLSSLRSRSASWIGAAALRIRAAWTRLRPVLAAAAVRGGAVVARAGVRLARFGAAKLAAWREAGTQPRMSPVPVPAGPARAAGWVTGLAAHPAPILILTLSVAIFAYLQMSTPVQRTVLTAQADLPVAPIDAEVRGSETAARADRPEPIRSNRDRRSEPEPRAVARDDRPSRSEGQAEPTRLVLDERRASPSPPGQPVPVPPPVIARSTTLVAPAPPPPRPAPAPITRSAPSAAPADERGRDGRTDRASRQQSCFAVLLREGAPAYNACIADR